MTIHVGVAGFDYPDWVGRVYPARVKGRDRLRHVARFVDCVEINSSFYRVPAVTSTVKWVEAVREQPRFVFAAKLWQGFTHGEAFPGSSDVAAFRAAMEPMAETGRLRAVLAQFPFFFHDDAGARERLARIAEAFAGLPLVLEVRHESFGEPEALAFVRDLGFSLATVDMPLAKETLRPHRHVTGPLGYVRLHGRNAGAWFTKDAGRDAKFDWLYAPRDVHRIADHVRSVAALAATTIVIANNHFSGQAFANALELIADLLARRVAVPPETVAAFPRLRGIATPDGDPPAGGQGTLFEP